MANSKRRVEVLSISQRMAENHRTSIMRKTGATSIPALARPALVAASRSGSDA